MADPSDDIFSEAYRSAQKAKAIALKEQAAKAGLVFEGYFVPDMAKWALEEIEAGHFVSPSEILLVAMQTFIELAEHSDLRQELLRRDIQKSLDDPGDYLPSNEVFKLLRKRIDEISRSKPARWASGGKAMMSYEGYEAVIEFDDEAEMFHGEVINLRDVITFQGTSVAELKDALKGSVEDYLAFCKERGEEPERPCPPLPSG